MPLLQHQLQQALRPQHPRHLELERARVRGGQHVLPQPLERARPQAQHLGGPDGRLGAERPVHLVMRAQRLVQLSAKRVTVTQTQRSDLGSLDGCVSTNIDMANIAMLLRA